jgi:hypothetical protein
MHPQLIQVDLINDRLDAIATVIKKAQIQTSERQRQHQGSLDDDLPG